MGKKYYAVKAGRTPGIYETWDECKAQTSGFKGARYKSFKTLDEAREFMNIDSHKQMIIDDDTLIAYVDGSFDQTVKAFSYGMVLLYKGNEKYFAEKYNDQDLATMRNVAGEIKGAQSAMTYALENGFQKIAIYYDYEGIEKWCIGEWKTNKEGTRAYREFYQEIEKKLQVKFIKVKGHSNDKYNDMADMLAKSALGIGDGSFVPGEGPLWLKKKDLQNN
ncbi:MULTISPECIES: ribonuclease H1 domain-containing protein [Anaerostipes]|uniref:ribonuclease H1 domain-containing protein n=1 Tax=Anaerostipes TaxID=207244 RepID=UPI000951588C|nr:MULTISPECIES: ribonuclease H family protein [Anaerostipes]MCI5622425.1 ribonuclease H family protein [Anaerostipes sp.]MDY2725791.1 ribonuclease H family protein [Anaerostipes faecalis]OLR58638.1 RNase H [Anaerostipes sp. 494a]